MVLRMSRPAKHPKTGVYWLRKRVPADVVAAFGRKVVTQTLSTKDPEEAKRRHTIAISKLEAAWQRLRSSATTPLDATVLDLPKVDRSVSITEREAHVLAAGEGAHWLAANRDNPSQQNEWDPAVYERLWLNDPDPPDILISDPRSRFSMRKMCSSLAERLLRENGWAVNNLSVRRAERAVAAAYQRAALVLQREAQGIFDTGVDLFASVPFFTSPPTVGEIRQPRPSHSTPNSSARSTPKLSGLIDGWWLENSAVGLTLSTYESYRNTFNNFVQFLKHDDASRVTMHDIVAFKDYRLHTPSPRTGKQVSAKTVKDSDLSALKSVFGWAVRNGYLEDNPAAKVTIKLAKPERLRLKGFTDDEAIALLTACLEIHKSEDDSKTSAAKRWAPWLCAFTGARLGEIVQLRKEDVSEQSGVSVIRITPEAITVKTKEAREVPVHQQIIDLGFSEFVRDAEDGYLFMSVGTGDNPRGPWRTVKNRVRDFARAIITDRHVAPNHGWRHRFKTVGMQAGIETRILDAIQGHAARTAGDQYGEVTLKTKADAIARLPFYDVGRPR